MADSYGARYLELAEIARERGIELGDPDGPFDAIYWAAEQLNLEPELALNLELPLREIIEFSAEVDRYRRGVAEPPIKGPGQ